MKEQVVHLCGASFSISTGMLLHETLTAVEEKSLATLPVNMLFDSCVRVCEHICILVAPMIILQDVFKRMTLLPSNS